MNMLAPIAPQPPAPPFDIELEQALLGTILANNKRQAEAAAYIGPDDFHDPLHGRIWDAICTLLTADMVAAPIVVASSLKEDPGMVELGGVSYLGSLVAAAPSTLNISDCARILRELAQRRAGMHAMEQGIACLAERSIPVIQAFSPVVSIADRVANENEFRTGTCGAGDAAQALMLELQNHDPSKLLGVPTGVGKLDELLGALYPENLIVVAGRPGMGKSAFGTTLAMAAARAGIGAEYFSLEMSKRELSARLVCDLDYYGLESGAISPIHYSRLLKRRVSEREFERAAMAARDLKSLPISIHDRDGMTMAEIAALARARASQRDGRLGIVIIDHLQIVAPSERYRGHRVSELTEMTGMAKGLAKAIKWPVVLLSQLSRDIEKRPEKERMPLLSDLRESGSIEQDADVVIGMLRPAHYIRHRKPALGERDPKFGEWLAEYEPVKNRLELGIIKNRHGASDTIKCFVDIGANAIRDEDPFGGAGHDHEVYR